MVIYLPASIGRCLSRGTGSWCWFEKTQDLNHCHFPTPVKKKKLFQTLSITQLMGTCSVLELNVRDHLHDTVYPIILTMILNAIRNFLKLKKWNMHFCKFCDLLRNSEVQLNVLTSKLSRKRVKSGLMTFRTGWGHSSSSSLFSLVRDVSTEKQQQ